MTNPGYKSTKKKQQPDKIITQTNGFALLTEGKVSKGGQNIWPPTTPRPSAPQGQGGSHYVHTEGKVETGKVSAGGKVNEQLHTQYGEDFNAASYGKYIYEHPMPSIVVDIVVTANKGKLLLLVERKKDPWKGCLALPGGFVEIDERIIEAAIRELKEETGITAGKISFIGIYDKPDRDPRGRIISMAFHVDCGDIIPDVIGMDDVQNARWVSKEEYDDIDHNSELAADHARIIYNAISWGDE